MLHADAEPWAAVANFDMQLIHAWGMTLTLQAMTLADCTSMMPLVCQTRCHVPAAASCR